MSCSLVLNHYKSTVLPYPVQLSGQNLEMLFFVKLMLSVAIVFQFDKLCLFINQESMSYFLQMMLS